MDQLMQNVRDIQKSLFERRICDLRIDPGMVEVVPWDQGNPAVEAIPYALKELSKKALHYHKREMQLVICGLPGERGDSKYTDCKAAVLHTCDLQIGCPVINVSCITKRLLPEGWWQSGGKVGANLAARWRQGGGKSFSKMGDFGPHTEPAYIQNLLLKFNTRLGGAHTSWEPHQTPTLKELLDPTIIIGGDCTRPCTGPGVAAIAGSVENTFTRYIGRFSRQPFGLGQQEILHNLKPMTVMMLKEWTAINRGVKPVNLIYLRDGVSVGQMDEVLEKEGQALVDAVQEMDGPGNERTTRICIIVICKGHKVHYYPQDERESLNGNPRPGTVVDDPDATDAKLVQFNMIAHAAIGRKSVKVPSYVCLYDEIWHPREKAYEVPLEHIQHLCFTLCHLYGYCRLAPALPAPVIYAHKVAERGRLYYQHLNNGSDSGSVSSTGDHGDAMSDQLPLHENIKNTMYW
ncbi:hypothetical protein CYMTET_39771 [Cymbomonas tetramitiformis]|uniref:Piwi domain-containing protein n=1 Tax=Cymbomonas tetramitiformis TaxID=36881 RepID=A0AAE0C9E6_9CHLO|nr:hypothetical protein CYMTET_39771 [Cymbomonas tetramitiformis]